MTQLEIRCKLLNRLFNQLIKEPSRTGKEILVNNFRKKHPKMEKDLDYCFEVLAGKHKLGYTYIIYREDTDISKQYENYTIRRFYEEVLKSAGSSQDEIKLAGLCTPYNCRTFICFLANRDFKLGYSNKHNMVTELSPMLAKKYPESHHEGTYYIQEKLDGNRCIAYYDYEEGKWKFQSRSGKPMKVDFDMSWVDKVLEEMFPDSYSLEYPTFDGEIMTLGKAGTRDFNRTSGVINGKYTDKSDLHYYIYDIIAPALKYRERKKFLDKCDNEIQSRTDMNCSILPVLDDIVIYPNPEYNWKLDEWLDKITDKGGEGLILRDPDGYYEVGKRSANLLKYKKLQTMDLRIIDFNWGNGKYDGAIGSFVCETDDHEIQVSVSGMPDSMHFSDPADWMGKIIEVAYFSISESKAHGHKSLRFPRLKRVRDDKDTTSIY